MAGREEMGGKGWEGEDEKERGDMNDVRVVYVHITCTHTHTHTHTRTHTHIQHMHACMHAHENSFL